MMYLTTALLDCVKADHGFNIDSKSIRNLLEILSSFSLNDRRVFLQFLTGSPKLPIGGNPHLLSFLTCRFQEITATVHSCM
jgi:E3 ubiquitin-protein ligase TRIP12